MFFKFSKYLGWNGLSLFSLLFLIVSCDGLEVRNENNYFFKGLESVSQIGENKYTFTWSMPENLPKDVTPEFELNYLGSMTSAAGLEYGLDGTSQIHAKQTFSENEFFVAKEKPLLDRITGQNSHTLDLNLAEGFFHVFQVKVSQPEIPSEENAVYSLFIEAGTNNLDKGWNFTGLQMAEIRGNDVYLKWDPPTGPNAVNSEFLFQIFQGVSFDNQIAESRASELLIPINNLDTSLPSIAFGVRAVRMGDLTSDNNVQIKFVELPDTIDFEGLNIQNVFINAELKIATLNWNAAENTVGEVTYLIYSDPSFNVAEQVTSELTVTLTNLIPGKKYYYGVRAQDSRGEDSNKNIVEIIVPDIEDTEPPIFGGVVTAQPVSESEGFISWDASPSEDIDGYVLYFFGDQQNPLKKVSKNFTSTTLTGLAPSSDYSVIVRAVDLSGNEDKNSITKDFRTLSSTAPTFDGASNVKPDDGIAGLTAIKVFWLDADWDLPKPGITENKVGYYVCWNKYNDNDNVGLLADPYSFDIEKAQKKFVSRDNVINQGFYLADNLDACHAETLGCKRYCFLVRAVDRRLPIEVFEQNMRVQCSPTSKYDSPSFGGASVASAAPDVTGFSTVSVGWPTAEGAFEGYHIYHKKSSEIDFDMNTYVKVDATKNVFSISGLDPTTSYDFMVLAYANDPFNPNDSDANPSLFGPQDGSGIVTATTIPPEPSFGGITDVVGASGEAGVNSVFLKYNAATGAFNRYLFYVREVTASYSSTPTVINVGNTGTGELSQFITGLEVNKTYCFFAKASYSNAPNDINSIDFLTSNNTQSNEKCHTLTMTPPTFTGIKTISNSETTKNSVTAALKVTFEEASGLFNRYSIYVGTSNPPTTEWAILDISKSIIGGSNTSIQCAENSGEACVILQELEYDTTYYVTAKAWHNTYSGIEDSPSDNIMHPAVLTTPARPPVLPLVEAKMIEGSFSDEATFNKFANVDNNPQVTTMDASADGRNAYALLEFDAGLETNPTDDINSIIFNISGEGEGYDSVDDSTKYGLKGSVVDTTIFGTGADGDILNASGGIESYTTTTGRVNVARNFAAALNHGSGDMIELDDVESTSTISSVLAVGDEVLVYQAQFRQDEASEGERWRTGRYKFVKLVNIDGRKLYFDQATGLSWNSNTTHNGWTTISRVAHLENLTLSGNLSGQQWFPSENNYARGGILALRISGTLDLGGHTLHMNGAGYKGGYAQKHGGGVRPRWDAPDHDSHAPYIGGAVDKNYNNPGGGGANGGRGGGYNGMEARSQVYGSDNLFPRFYMGGGGAGGRGGTCDDANTGTDGGGIILIYANKIVNGTIKSNGDNKGTYRGGAGAGGTIWIQAASVSNVNLEARGGDVDRNGSYCNTSANEAPGTGGGGRIRYDILHHSNLTTDVSKGEYLTTEANNIDAEDGTVYVGDSAGFLQQIDSETAFSTQQRTFSGLYSTDFDKFFTTKNRLYLYLESPYPTSNANTIDAVMSLDQVKTTVNWK